MRQRSADFAVKPIVRRALPSATIIPIGPFAMLLGGRATSGTIRSLERGCERSRTWPKSYDAVIANLGIDLAQRQIRSKELAETIGRTESNLSLFKSGRVKGARFATLAAIFRYLEYEPGDILGYVSSDADLNGGE